MGKFFKDTENLNILGYTVIMTDVNYHDEDLDTMYLYSESDIIKLAIENCIDNGMDKNISFDYAVGFLQDFCEYKVMAIYN